MASYRKTIVSRLFTMAKPSFSSSSRTKIHPPHIININTKPRFLHRSFFQSTAVPGLHPYLALPPKRDQEGSISIEEARKVLRASRMEATRARLRGMDKSRVSYPEFVEICCEGAGGFEQGMEVAMVLDESGDVIVLGGAVFLHPDEVARAIESVVPISTPEEKYNDLRTDELKAMQEQKAEIDKKANTLVKRELWCGLSLLLLQTIGFMRLTFWELSWDVMEPVCFFVTSLYFMVGYTFFLRTSKDPSFEGFFKSRFKAKQKKLMKMNKFDVEKFNELMRVCSGSDSGSSIRVKLISQL